MRRAACAAPFGHPNFEDLAITIIIFAFVIVPMSVYVLKALVIFFSFEAGVEVAPTRPQIHPRAPTQGPLSWAEVWSDGSTTMRTS